MLISFPGTRVFVPKCDSQKMDMLEISGIEDYRLLPRNSFGYPEPEDFTSRASGEFVQLHAFIDRSEHLGIAAIEEGLDLVIMPGLAFDGQGWRIGYGKGYYDRFLLAYAKARGEQPFKSTFVRSALIIPELLISPQPKSRPLPRRANRDWSCPQSRPRPETGPCCGTRACHSLSAVDILLYTRFILQDTSSQPRFTASESQDSQPSRRVCNHQSPFSTTDRGFQ